MFFRGGKITFLPPENAIKFDENSDFSNAFLKSHRKEKRASFAKKLTLIKIQM